MNWSYFDRKWIENLSVYYDENIKLPKNEGKERKL